MRRHELFGILNKFGWTLKRDHGTHAIFERGGRTERVALGGDQEMGGGGLKEIFKRFGIEAGDGSTNQRRKRRVGSRDVEAIPKEGSFGRRIYDARTAQGMSQGDLARHIGMAQGPISSWERGVATPFNRHGDISFKTTKVALGKMAQLFGWEDIARLSGVTLKPPVQLEEPKPQIAEPETQPFPDARTRLGPDAKAFYSIIRPADVAAAMEDLEERIRELEREIARIHRSDIGVLRIKADLYDKIVGIVHKAEDGDG